MSSENSLFNPSSSGIEFSSAASMRALGLENFRNTTAQNDPQGASIRVGVPANRLDTSVIGDNHARMNSPTREEINSKLEATEARMDARVASAVGRIDTLAAQLVANEANMARLSERAVAASERAAAASEQAAAAAVRAAHAADGASGLKSTMWITSITTILAVLGIAFAAYFGTQASNIGIVGSTISAFQAGREAAGSDSPTSEQKSAVDTAKPSK